MGEIAEMMLSGFLDEETGEIIDGDEPGFPRRASDPNCYYRDRFDEPVRTPEQIAARRAKNKRKRARKAANKAAKAEEARSAQIRDGALDAREWGAR